MPTYEHRSWRIEFARWLPEAPNDGRSPWSYLEHFTPADRFASASDAAFGAYEDRVLDPYGDGVLPLFRPAPVEGPRPV